MFFICTERFSVPVKRTAKSAVFLKRNTFGNLVTKSNQINKDNGARLNSAFNGLSKSDPEFL